ncbi:MAG: SurA N-terminal domain-containing protein [Pseudomonadota bacterium]
MHDSNDSQPSLRWLVIGALGGLLAAGYGLLESSGPDTALPAYAVATVNDTVIQTRQLDQAFAELFQGEQDGDTDRLRAEILQRLIDEELLVQRGINLGLATSETTVRTAIVASMVASVTAEADAADPDDAALEAFMQANAERYTYASALRLEAWTTDDELIARRFIRQLRTESDPRADDVTPVPGLPKAPAPLERLRMFVGPAIAAAAADMPEGGSAIFARQDRWYVVRVLEHAGESLATLDSVRSQVLLDYRRARADRRLAEYLLELRQGSDIVVRQ